MKPTQSISFGQGGTPQGQYLRSLEAPQRNPLTVFGRIRVVQFGPNVMSAFFGRDSGPGSEKEWSLFTAPSGDGLEISLEVQTPKGSSGLGYNVADPFGWHDVSLVRKDSSWALSVDGSPARVNPVVEILHADSVMSVGYVPGMFGGLLYSICDLADWRIWEAVLTDAELAKERASQRPIRTANLWAAWPLKRPAEAARDGLRVVRDSGTALLK